MPQVQRVNETAPEPQVILVDAGPLVAIVDADDQHHAKCVAALRGLGEALATVWPPLVEAMYMLTGLPRARQSLWERLERGAIRLLLLDIADAPRMNELVEKYADRPMDLADAALIRVAEREGITKIFTVDRKDFSVYRLDNRIRPILLP
jgi:uncharacterized protein